MANLAPLIVSFSNTVPDSDRYYMCNGLEINNTDSAAVSELADFWVIHMSEDNALTYIVIFEPCVFDYRAYEFSPTGIEKVEF